MSRTKKHPYTKSKAIDSTCRCHGSCEYCQSNRMHRDKKRKEKSEESLKEWKQYYEKEQASNN